MVQVGGDHGPQGTSVNFGLPWAVENGKRLEQFYASDLHRITNHKRSLLHIPYTIKAHFNSCNFSVAGFS
jgi:hypothetical protein